MKEGTERCEHCGNLNRSGALHCDICGRGIAANLAVRRGAYTRKSRICFALCPISVLAAAAIIFSEDYLSYPQLRSAEVFSDLQGGSSLAGGAQSVQCQCLVAKSTSGGFPRQRHRKHAQAIHREFFEAEDAKRADVSMKL